MRFAFANRKLEALYLEGKGARKYPPEVYTAFVAAVNLIATMPDERSLYALPGLHFEKLQGDRKGQHSIRLNQQFRLCLEIISDSNGNLLFLLEIVDYH